MSHIVWRGVLSTCAGGPRWERSGGFVAHMMVSHVVIWNLAAAALTSLCCSDGSDVPSQLWFGFIQLCVLGAAARSGGFCSALERHRVCGAAIALRLCPSVCVCVWIIVIIQVIQVADGSGTLRKTHMAGIWTSPLIERQHEIPQPVTMATGSLDDSGLWCHLSLSLSLHSLLMMFQRLAHSSPVTQWASLMGGTEREMLPLLHHCCNVINLKSDW